MKWTPALSRRHMKSEWIINIILVKISLFYPYPFKWIKLKLCSRPYKMVHIVAHRAIHVSELVMPHKICSDGTQRSHPCARQWSIQTMLCAVWSFKIWVCRAPVHNARIKTTTQFTNSVNLQAVFVRSTCVSPAESFVDKYQISYATHDKFDNLYSRSAFVLSEVCVYTRVQQHDDLVHNEPLRCSFVSSTGSLI